jgi:hypothetical protein
MIKVLSHLEESTQSTMDGLLMKILGEKEVLIESKL